MSYTKGPWRVYPQHTSFNGYELWDEHDNFHKNVEWEERLLNAQVMQAAPDMLEALEAIVARIDGAFDHPSLLKYGPLSIGHNDDVRRIATQAIAKSKGGQA